MNHMMIHHICQNSAEFIMQTGIPLIRNIISSFLGYDDF